MSQAAPPRVTVLGAIYNDAPFLREAMDSVLGQTFTDFEYLIVNDCAIDDSRAIAGSYTDPRIRIIDNETNIGLTRSLNRGLSLARGELIARFDSNDICFPERLAKQVAYLDAHPDVAAVGVQAIIVDVHGRRIRRAETLHPTSDAAMTWYSMFGTPLIHGGTMFRRSVVWGELGGYDEEFRVAQDGELWRRLRQRHRMANLPEQLMASRVDPRSISGDTTLEIRVGHRERWIRLAGQTMRQILEWEHVPEEWAVLLADVNLPDTNLAEGQALRFVDALDLCFRRFCELHPEARSDREIAKGRLYLMQRAAEKAAATSRVAVASIAARMVRIDAAGFVPLFPRLAILGFGGDVPLRAWRRRRQQRAARR